MSRVGKRPIEIPNGVNISVEGQTVKVSGPKGELSLEVLHPIGVVVEGNQVFCNPAESIKGISAFWGLYRALINNMLIGVSTGYQKQMKLEGVGYRVALQGTKLVMNLGFSHPVEIEAPQGITFGVEKNTITVSGIDKTLVGQTAANIRAKKKPEPYKGKGIAYADEVVRRKAGKKAS
jgi:large subunit ribosomal protein L6